MIKLLSVFNNKRRQKPSHEVKANSPDESPYTLPIADQRQATLDIIESTPLNNDSISLDKLSDISKERSDRLYDERQQRVNSFNPFKIDIKPSPLVSLSSTEKYFLKAMHGQNVDSPTLYAYWTYEYSIDFEKLMTKLIENEFLHISDSFFEVKCLKVEQLKVILKKYNLKVNGKKDELIQRVCENIPFDVLSSELGNQHKTYLLTEKGQEVVADLPLSMTKNLELEDLCMKHILACQFDIAYKLVCENELKKIIPRGVGINWNDELIKGLPAFNVELFNRFVNNDTVPIPTMLKPYNKELKACAIMGVLFGVDSRKVANLFVRTVKPSTIEKNELISTLQNMQFMLLDAIQKNSFLQF